MIKNHPGKVLEKLQRFFNRSRPEKSELGILRGVLAAVQRETEKARLSDQDDK